MMMVMMIMVMMIMMMRAVNHDGDNLQTLSLQQKLACSELIYAARVASSVYNI